MLEKNGVAKVKLFDANPDALAALANSKIEVMVMVRNEYLEPMAVKQENADNWVYDNLVDMMPTGVNITSVSVGNEPFLHSRHEFDDFLAPAFRNMHRALLKYDYADRIKLTVSFNTEILDKSSPPSAGRFKPVWAKQIETIAKVINETESFFSVNIYPFFSLKDDKGVPEKFVFFDDGAGGAQCVDDTVDGDKVEYCNILDASYDATLAALGKINLPNLPVVIGEAGWPSDGHPIATVANAKRYNNGLVKHMLNGKGTPRRRNHRAVFYLFDLFDQDAKSITAGAFERRWGVYDDYGRAKYDLDLTGGTAAGGKAWKLAPIPNVARHPKRWCVANRLLYEQRDAEADTVDALLLSKINDICGESDAFDFGQRADCTPVFGAMTTPGMQCAKFGGGTEGLLRNASFALNALYQLQLQDEKVCVEDGAGVVVEDRNPSSGSAEKGDLCTFELGLDIAEMMSFTQPGQEFSWKVLGYIVALIVILANML